MQCVNRVRGGLLIFLPRSASMRNGEVEEGVRCFGYSSEQKMVRIYNVNRKSQIYQHVYDVLNNANVRVLDF